MNLFHSDLLQCTKIKTKNNKYQIKKNNIYNTINNRKQMSNKF